MDRQSFCRLPFLMMMAVQSGCFMALHERTQPHREQIAENAKRPRTKQELIDLLQEEYGYTLQIVNKAPEPPVDPRMMLIQHTATPSNTTMIAEERSTTAPPAAPVMEQKNDMGKRLSSVSDRLRQCSPSEIYSAVQWLQGYRMSETQKEMASEEQVDCNDHCNNHCERLSFHYGMPMYMVAYWPTDEARTGLDSWHIVAACKLGDREFLLLDNRSTATFWHGSLEEYGQEYPRRLEGWKAMSVIPHVGIARYVRPKHAHSTLAKIFLQLEHHCGEQDMEPLPLEKSVRSGEQYTTRQVLQRLWSILTKTPSDKAA